ncbi:fused (3R)-hydroxyacyl-ACP dehydratase subunits HadA/HadB [Nocardia higoensis]|uniref:fused (3R)-hydroxyacyl-ACP dehydratase subunits HadA/HadB n=1 Tax=Nocardia higoensis TaxID=228599 RepID=UPI001FE0EA5C|nr:fused (3R)-hydroxyacyl-ACP dehydratase subunits HadA/HadB [Nocardia higoensis]
MTAPETEAAAMASPEITSTRELAGRRFLVRDPYHVGREKVREFARAVRNRHGAHRSDEHANRLGFERLLAPPTFSSVIGMAATNALLDSVLLEYDLAQVLQTDQTFELRRPFLPGDAIRTQVIIESIRTFGDNDFISVRAEMTDQHDEIVQIASTTIVARRGAEIDPDLAKMVQNIFMHSRPVTPAAGITESGVLIELDDRTPAGRKAALPPVHTIPVFADLAKGDELPASSARLTRGDLVNYAGVAGDPNPIHFSEEAARLVGLPTVVAHGMLTMGLAADYLTSWLGDPTAIETFSVRFSGFVPVGIDAPSVIDFSGKIKALHEDRRAATVMLGATSQGRKLFGRAVADVRLS